MNIASVRVARLHKKKERVAVRERRVRRATHIATDLHVVVSVAAWTRCCGYEQTEIDAQIAS